MKPEIVLTGKINQEAVIRNKILELIRKKEEEGYDMVPIFDIKEGMNDIVDYEIENLAKRGYLYLPRRHFVKLVKEV